MLPYHEYYNVQYVIISQHTIFTKDNFLVCQYSDSRVQIPLLYNKKDFFKTKVLYCHICAILTFSNLSVL